MSAYVMMLREHVTDPAEVKTYARLAPLAREGHHIERLAVWSREVMARIIFEGLRILMPLFQDKANRRTPFQRA